MRWPGWFVEKYSVALADYGRLYIVNINTALCSPLYIKAVKEVNYRLNYLERI
jgi:hypothetical protein